MVAFDSNIVLPQATLLCIYALAVGLTAVALSVAFLAFALLQHTQSLPSCTCRRQESRKEQ